jgi:peptidoglycan biosynthesis/recognition FemAB-like protein
MAHLPSFSFKDNPMMQITANPLDHYTSFHKVSLHVPMSQIQCLSFSMIFSFSLHTPSPFYPQPLLRFNARDSDKPPAIPPDFSFEHLIRWRLEISKDQSFEDYLQNLSHLQYKTYKKTERNFTAHGATISIIEGDWSEHADAVYQLYANVASQHPPGIYDIEFFRHIAKKSDYKLISAWVNGLMFGAVVVLEEGSFIHSVCCGLDYHHSKISYAYSWMHYELIRFAIESKRFTIADAGFTGDKGKKLLNFKPVCCCMDVYANRWIMRRLLRSAGRLFKATITSESRIKTSLRSFRR